MAKRKTRKSSSKKTTHPKISPKALGLSLGILTAVSIFLLGIFAKFGLGHTLVLEIGSFYRGYGPGFSGSIIGAIWGFIDGFIGGWVIAWLYNKFA